MQLSRAYYKKSEDVDYLNNFFVHRTQNRMEGEEEEINDGEPPSYLTVEGWRDDFTTYTLFEEFWDMVVQQGVDLQEKLRYGFRTRTDYWITRMGVVARENPHFIMYMLRDPQICGQVEPYVHALAQSREMICDLFHSREMVGHRFHSPSLKMCYANTTLLGCLLQSGAWGPLQYLWTFVDPNSVVWMDGHRHRRTVFHEYFRCYGCDAEALRAFMVSRGHLISEEARRNFEDVAMVSSLPITAELKRFDEWYQQRESARMLAWMCDWHVLPSTWNGVGMLLAERFHCSYADYVEDRDAWDDGRGGESSSSSLSLMDKSRKKKLKTF